MRTTVNADHYPSHKGSDILIATCLIAFLGLAGYGFIAAFPQFQQAAIILAWFFLALVLVVIIYLLLHKRQVDALNLQAKADEVRHKDELHRLQVEEALLLPDISGNYAVIWNRQAGQIIRPEPGQYIPNVPEHYHYTYNDTSSRVSEALPTSTPSLLPEKCLMLDVMRHWDLRSDNLFLALGKGNQEIACTLEDLMHVAHDAPTGGGKTAQFYAEIIMLLKLGVRVILANPHFAPLGKKGEDWRPIGRAIEAQGMIEIAPDVAIPGLIRNYTSIANMLQWLATVEIDRRFDMQAAGDYSYKPIYIFMDEWPAVVRRHPEAAEYHVDVLQRGRAVEVCIDTNSQGFLSEDVDLKGSARENFQTAFHMGGSVYSGAKLLDMQLKDLNALLRTEQVILGKGIALLRNNAAVPQAQLVRLPYADNNYCYHMLGQADEWMLPEMRTGNRTETRVTAVEAEASPQKGPFPVSQETTIQARFAIPAETVNTMKRMSEQGQSHRKISEAVGLTGRKYSNIYRPLCKELGIEV